MAARPVVLLVDDDPLMRELLSDMFSIHGGFRIGGVASDGFEGAMLAADTQPDVVVLDFFMPRWDGSKCAEFIRKNCPDSRIVAFSAVLTDAPDWGDHFLVKNEVQELIPLCESMCANGSPNQN
ncbi:MAG TPA: response regulator transcription factor [Actinomycetota bacterium]|nr:response regulator transcription factor [Actinomycetota bacterium]